MPLVHAEDGSVSRQEDALCVCSLSIRTQGPCWKTVLSDPRAPGRPLLRFGGWGGWQGSLTTEPEDMGRSEPKRERTMIIKGP